MAYATAARTVATNMGPRLINALVKPVATAKRVNAMPSFTNLLSSIVRNFCKTGSRNKATSDVCKPDIGIIVYGENHGELTEHISDAYWSLKDSQVILTNLGSQWSRGWLNNHRGVGQACFNTSKGSGYQCDEYPFASTVQGGEDNYIEGNVSIRAINQRDNSSGGQLLGGFIVKEGFLKAKNLSY